MSKYINKLGELIPSLKTMETEDKEIDDFIRNVRMSGIDKITEQLRVYQKNMQHDRHNQGIDNWGSERDNGDESNIWY